MKFLLKFLLFCATVVIWSRGSGQDLPVMAFHGVPEQFTSKESFRMLKESGININFTVYSSNAKAREALDCAQENGVKILLLTPELVHHTAATVRMFKDHPALFGYYVRDEPTAAEFTEVSAKIKEIKSLDPFHPTYVNLFPNYADSAQLKTSSYDEYLRRYISTVPSDFISFDNYPLMNNVIHKDWFANLEAIRNASITAKKEFWGFANATIFRTYRQPTLAGLRLQIYGNLLYGAQGLQYFTYWTLDDEYWRRNKFGRSMVDERGQPTATYHLVKRINSEVQNYALLFKGSQVTEIYHTDTRIPIQTRPLPNHLQGMKNFNIDGPAVVSYFQNKNGNYVAILNKDLYTPIAVSFNSTAAMQVLGTSGLQKRIEKGRNVRARIGAGDIVVFRL